MLLSDNYLIIQDDRGHDFYYHSIHRISGELDLEFGKKGNGPGELLYASGNPLFNCLKNELQVFDSNGKRFCYYKLDENVANCMNVVDISKKNNLFLLELLDLDTCYLATGMNGVLDDFRFVVFDKSFEPIHTFEKYPVLDYNREENQKINEELFNIYFLKTSPDKKHLLFASYRIGLMEIFSLEALPENIHKVRSLLLTKPMKYQKENIFGFEDVYVTNKYIYALHNGKTAKENPYLSQSIKIFDWQGNPVVEYNTGIDMRCLAVDEDRGIIYAVAYNDDDGFFLIQVEFDSTFVRRSAFRCVEAKSKAPALHVWQGWNFAANPAKSGGQCRPLKAESLRAIAQGIALRRDDAPYPSG
jgi:hypothetical protein